MRKIGSILLSGLASGIINLMVAAALVGAVIGGLVVWAL